MVRPEPEPRKKESSAAPTAASLETLLPQVLDAAYGTALRLTRNQADAEDVVQDAAFLATRGFNQFEAGTNFRAWFLRIVINAFYSRYRKGKREGTPVELEDSPELYLYSQITAAGLHAQAEDPASLLMNQLDAEAVTQAIDALPEEYRLVATLYFIQESRYQDIAEMTGIPIGTVRSRLHRGRRLLQKSLWSIAEDRGIIRRLEQGGGRSG